jgi:CRP-like cAMP-binding protein
MTQDAIKQNIINNVKVETYSMNEFVYKEGELSNGKIYFVLDGELLQSKNNFPIHSNLTLKKGDLFGEMVMVQTQIRGESIKVASKIARLMAIKSSDFINTLKLNKVMMQKLLQNARVRYKSDSEIITQKKITVDQFEYESKDLDRIRISNLGLIEKVTSPKINFYDQNQQIFWDNDPNNGIIYLIENGKVVIKKKAIDKQENFIITELERGDLFGESTYFGDPNRGESAFANIPKVKVREFHSKVFETLLNSSLNLFINFVLSILWKVMKMEDRIRRHFEQRVNEG